MVNPSKQILCFSMHLYYLNFHLFNPNIWCLCGIPSSGVSVLFSNSVTITLEVDNKDNVSQEINVSYYVSTRMPKNRVYSLKKVVQCKL